MCIIMHNTCLHMRSLHTYNTGVDLGTNAHALLLVLIFIQLDIYVANSIIISLQHAYSYTAMTIVL